VGTFDLEVLEEARKREDALAFDCVRTADTCFLAAGEPCDSVEEADVDETIVKQEDCSGR
jgi:hypothetical protein